MRVRHTHKIGRQTFKLAYRAAFDENGNPKAGLCDWASRTILVTPALRKDKNEHDRTVWHEIIHAINWEYGLSIGHHTIERLSIAIANYAEDNGLDYPDGKKNERPKGHSATRANHRSARAAADAAHPARRAAR